MFCKRKQNRSIFSRPYKVFCLGFLLIQGCLIKHVRALLVLSLTRNRLPTIASFLSCDSLTPQIRPGCLMTASHLSAHTNSLTETQPALLCSPAFYTHGLLWLDVSKQKSFILDTGFGGSADCRHSAARLRVRLRLKRFLWSSVVVQSPI